MVVLLLPLLAVLGLTLHDIVRRPTLRRLALRNANRRRGEAALVLIGSLLGTAIICASLVTGDSLRASIRDFARTQLGPIDEVVGLSGTSQLDAATRAISARGPVGGTDGGPLPMVHASATAAAGSRAEPRSALLEIDFDAARAFGRDPGSTGFAGAGASPGNGEADVSQALAESLHLRVGGPVDVYAYGARLSLRVRRLLPKLGIAGFWQGQGSTSNNLFVAPGTIERLAARGPAGARPPDGLVLLSNDGGVFSGAAGSAEVKTELQRRLVSVPGAAVFTVKKTNLDNADAAGASFRRLFTGMGTFSVIAGILLLVNIFVMLAEERKSELGMLRALGLKRSQLVRAFGIEGGLYSLVAAGLGAVAGIGLGRAIVAVAAVIFRTGANRNDALNLRFAPQPSSVVIGGIAGLAISLATVWLASVRIGRLNVIRAIRDVPEPATDRRRVLGLVLGTAGVVVGALMFVSGVGAKAWFPAAVGPVLALWGATPLLRPALGRRAAVTLTGTVIVAWAASAFVLLPGVFRGIDIPGFVVQGVVLVAAAVAVVATNDDLFSRVGDRLSGSNRGLAARLGMAYPLAQKFRTSMTLGMYALVVFTLTFIAVVGTLFAHQGPTLTRKVDAGYDVLVDSNPAAPATAALLESQPGVAKATPVLRTFAQFTTPSHPSRDFWSLTGFDAALLSRGAPTLSRRDRRFPSDRAAWEAVLRDPSLAVIPSFFLQHGGGPSGTKLVPGDHLTIYDSRSGRQHQLTVAGVATGDFDVFSGVWVSMPFAREFLGPDAAPSRVYVAVQPGRDAEAVARRLTATLIASGVDAHSFRHIIDDGLQTQEGFFRLISGYLALGLVVGVAGLGVIMVRAVRERRRQIGMLRAMGFSAGVVRAAFLFEAAFVALQGIVIGVALALLVSYQVLSNSKTFGNQQLAFRVPWLSLAVLLTAAMAASLASTLVPAVQASRVRPAVALRIAD